MPVSAFSSLSSSTNRIIAESDGDDKVLTRGVGRTNNDTIQQHDDTRRGYLKKEKGKRGLDGLNGGCGNG